VQVNNKTFCAGAWFQLRSQQNGEFRPCCEIDPSKTEFQVKTCYKWPENQPGEFLDSPYLQYLRQKMQEGIRISECEKCWTKEDNNMISLRQTLNDTVTNNLFSRVPRTWVNVYLGKKTDFHHDLLISADIKLSNVCNFSCMMCNPDDSTQIYSIWTKNLQHPVVMEFLQTDPDYLDNIKKNYQGKANYDLLTAVLDQVPHHVKILGGEPLLDNKMLGILQKLPNHKKSKISLCFVTNGSVDLIGFAQKLKGYRQINYVVSLDGIGKMQNYIRRGSEWSSIEKNIVDWCKNHRAVDVHCTVQCLNALHVEKLINWCNDAKIKVTFGFVNDPEYLSLSVLPLSLRELIKDQTKEHGSNLAGILDHYDYRPDLLPKLKTFLDWYDPENHWHLIFPE